MVNDSRKGFMTPSLLYSLKAQIFAFEIIGKHLSVFPGQCNGLVYVFQIPPPILLQQLTPHMLGAVNEVQTSLQTLERQITRRLRASSLTKFVLLCQVTVEVVLAMGLSHFLLHTLYAVSLVGQQVSISFAYLFLSLAGEEIAEQTEITSEPDHQLTPPRSTCSKAVSSLNVHLLLVFLFSPLSVRSLCISSSSSSISVTIC